MDHRRGWTCVQWALVAIVSVAAVWGCRAPPQMPSAAPTLDEDEWLPIRDEQPPAPGDVREMKNCAEHPFVDVWRGPWDRIASKKRAERASVQHRTTDRVVSVGQRARVGARMQYDEGPLAREWVRLFVGTCEGWSQIGVRKTDDDGNIVFELRERLSAGVYGVVFQAVGDATIVRAQLWVLPRQAEVVAVELGGAAFEVAGALQEPSRPEPVAGAPSLTRWHAGQGRAVVYVDDAERLDAAPSGVEPLQWWRRQLRNAGFAVGPVVAGLGPDDAGGGIDVPSGWGQAGVDRELGSSVQAFVSRLYTVDSTSAARWERNFEVGDTIHRRQYCQPHTDRAGRTGWTTLVTELRNDEDGDDS